MLTSCSSPRHPKAPMLRPACAVRPGSAPGKPGDLDGVGAHKEVVFDEQSCLPPLTLQPTEPIAYFRMFRMSFAGCACSMKTLGPNAAAHSCRYSLLPQSVQ